MEPRKHGDSTVILGYAGGYAQMVLNRDHNLDPANNGRWTVRKQHVSQESFHCSKWEYEDEGNQPAETFATLELALLWCAQEINR